MRGYSHAVSGAAVWTVIAAPKLYLTDLTLHPEKVPHIPITPGLLHVTPSGYALGLMLSAGAALLADADHVKASIAYSLPPLGPIPSPTQLLCKAIEVVAGGHRHGTHSILGVIAFTALAWLAGLWKMTIGGVSVAIGSGLFAFFLTAFVLKVFHIGKEKEWFLRWVTSAIFAGVITWWFPHEWNILPIIVCLGCITHLLGDFLTVGGVPWLYPIKPQPPEGLSKIPFLRKVWQKNGWFSFPILGKTDTSTGSSKRMTRENVLTMLLSAYILIIGVLTAFVFLGLHR